MFFVLALGIGSAYFLLGWSSNTIPVVRLYSFNNTYVPPNYTFLNICMHAYLENNYLKKYRLKHLLTSLSFKHISCHYRQEYFRSILAKPIAFFDADENSSGTLTARVANDPTQLQQLLGINMAMVLTALLSVFGCVIIGFILGWKVRETFHCLVNRYLFGFFARLMKFTCSWEIHP